MDYKLVADSSCDLNDELRERLDIGLVPLKIDVEDKSFIDDGSLDIIPLIEAMKNSKKGIMTSSPSPADFMKYYEKAENIFTITISSKLSSTYNNALLAKNMILETKDKFIHVFDSKSASVGETLVSMKVFELIQEKLNPDEIIEKVNEYIEEMETFFILESLDNLIKAGRMNKLVGHVASALNIKPIMGAEDGEIELVDKVRGNKRAFKRLVEIVGEKGEDLENKVLGIAHCNAPERAEEFKKDIEEKYNFKEIVVVNTGGLSTAYANDGGLVIAF